MYFTIAENIAAQIVENKGIVFSNEILMGGIEKLTRREHHPSVDGSMMQFNSHKASY